MAKNDKSKKGITVKKVAEATADLVTYGAYSIAKNRVQCKMKDGKWIKGECVPKSEIRTGKKK